LQLNNCDPSDCVYTVLGVIEYVISITYATFSDAKLLTSYRRALVLLNTFVHCLRFFKIVIDELIWHLITYTHSSREYLSTSYEIMKS